MNGDVDAEIERPAKVRRIESRIYHERYVMIRRNLYNRFEIENVEPGIADEFAVNQARVVLHGIAKPTDVSRVDKGCGNSKPW